MKHTLQLTPDETTWLTEYRQALSARHPGTVVRMVVYGSKARGEARPDSDIDVLLIIKNDAGPLKLPVREMGYELAATSDAVPLILAYPEEDWRDRREKGCPLQREVERDGVSVLGEHWSHLPVIPVLTRNPGVEAGSAYGHDQSRASVLTETNIS